MQVNQPQGGIAEATTTPLAIGDTVSFVAMSCDGQAYRLSARTAVIIGIAGDVATLRTANGSTISLPLDELTPDGEPNALTRLLERGR